MGGEGDGAVLEGDGGIGGEEEGVGAFGEGELLRVIGEVAGGGPWGAEEDEPAGFFVKDDGDGFQAVVA